MSDELLIQAAKIEAAHAIGRLCDDPDVWLTHGEPPTHKLARIEEEMVRVVQNALLRSRLMPENEAATELQTDLQTGPTPEGGAAIVGPFKTAEELEAWHRKNGWSG